MNLDNQEMNAGQTMFQYLKRKKKSLIEETLSRSKLTSKHPSFLDRKAGKSQNENQAAKNCSLRTNVRIQRGNEENLNTSNQPNITQQRKSTTRSFLQMISPIRSKSPLLKQMENSLKVSPLSKKDAYKDNYTKRMLIEKINKVRDIIQTLTRDGRVLKQKCHFLFVDLKPIFKHIDHCNDSKFQKRTEEIKAQVKAIEPIFNEFNLQTSSRDLDSFFKHFSQYVNELEGNRLAEIQENKNSLVTEITTKKNIELAQLKDTIKKLQRQLNYARKNYQKSENTLEQFRINTQSELQAKSAQLNDKNKKLQQLKESIALEKNELQRKNEDLKQKTVECENQIKKLKVEREKYQQECLNTITRVKSQQEQFLLNQILVLKKQFNNDINQMAQLYKTKQQEFINRIKDLAFQNETEKAHLEDLLKANLQMQELTNINKAQAARYKKQNEALAIDMHRINEQLYQYWLALKDIRVLSTRLDRFYKFKKIYDEIGFNQQLFL